MPSRPAKLTTLNGPDSVHVVNQLFREIEGRLDDIQRSVPKHTYLKSTSTLVFGTVGAQSTTTATVLVPNASTTGVAHASPAQGLSVPNGISYDAFVSAQNQVTVRLTNVTTVPIAVNTQKWNVWCLQ